MREKPVLEKATSLGFPYQPYSENCWQIFPKQRGETWKLTSAGARWILSLKNVPQLYLDSEEAIAFLVMLARN